MTILTKVFNTITKYPLTWRLLGSVILFMVLTLLIEALLRLYYQQPLVERYFRPVAAHVGYGLEQSADFEYLHGGRRVRVTTDGEGRRVVPGAPQAPDLRVVHVLGDSQIFGWGLNDSETVPAQLQVLLGDGWRVVNHGVPGYGPFAYAEQLVQIPSKDLVLVVQTEANDLRDAYLTRPPVDVRCGGYLVPRGFLGEQTPCFVLSAFILAKAIELWVDFGESRRPTPLGFNPFTRGAAEVLKYRIEMLYRQQIGARSGDVILAVIPWDASVLPERAANYRPLVPEPVRLTALRDDCDLATAFHSHPEPRVLFQRDDFHLTPTGSTFVAEQLEPHVRGRAADGAVRVSWTKLDAWLSKS